MKNDIVSEALRSLVILNGMDLHSLNTMHLRTSDHAKLRMVCTHHLWKII